MEKRAVEFIHDEISHLPQTGLNDYYDGLEEPDVFQKVRAFCETGGAPEALRLYRTVPNSKKENFIIDIDAQDFSPGYIKERFGGGDYIIKAYDSNSKISLKQHLSIEGEPIVQTARPMGLSVIQPSATPQLDIAALMQAMQESNRQLLAGLMQVMQPQQHSRADMLAELAQMRDIFGAPQQQSAINPMDMLIKGIELAGSMAPKAGGETSGMDVLLESIKSFAPAIGAVVAQSASNQARAPQPRPAPTVQPQAMIENTATAEQPQLTQEDNEAMMFKYYVGMLVGFAAENRDPALYADLIADNLPENKINELLNHPDVIGMLGGVNPGVLVHRAWFEAVISELRQIFSLTELVNPSTVIASNTQLSAENVSIGSAENANNIQLARNTER